MTFDCAAKDMRSVWDAQPRPRATESYAASHTRLVTAVTHVTRTENAESTV
jgi:hypothetical protein